MVTPRGAQTSHRYWVLGVLCLPLLPIGIWSGVGGLGFILGVVLLAVVALVVVTLPRDRPVEVSA